MSQTLPRVHEDLQFDSDIPSLHPNSVLVYNAKEINQGIWCGSVGIRIDKYNICEELFFREEDFLLVDDIKFKTNISSICGYVELKNISNDLLKILKSSSQKIDEPAIPNLYGLIGEDRLELHLYYKVRIKEMERKQGTSALESALLDTLQFKKTKYGRKFNTKNYIKYLSKRCNFPEAKLYSGIQKRRAQKRWAKQYFLDIKNKNK